MTRPICCNHNCGQGDRCPLRAPRHPRKREWLAVLLLVVVVAAVCVLTGCKRKEIVDQSVAAKVERLEQRVHQLERHECGGQQ